MLRVITGKTENSKQQHLLSLCSPDCRNPTERVRATVKEVIHLGVDLVAHTFDRTAQGAEAGRSL